MSPDPTSSVARSVSSSASSELYSFISIEVASGSVMASVGGTRSEIWPRGFLGLTIVVLVVVVVVVVVVLAVVDVVVLVVGPIFGASRGNNILGNLVSHESV